MVSFGDAHALQGDGEVALTALEVSVSGVVQIILHKDRSLVRPRAETPTHFITMGLHPDLDEAARMATREMIDFLVEERGLTREGRLHSCFARGGSSGHSARGRHEGHTCEATEGDLQVAVPC